MVRSSLCQDCIYEPICKHKEKIEQIEKDNEGKVRGIGWHIVIGACGFKKGGE